MRHDLRYIEPEPASRAWPKILLGALGGFLYIVAALVVMQIAFLFWSGTW